MLHETRVNLLHLLEDIRDSYAAPLEEVIITELVANALDSGASRIDFTVDPVEKFIRVVDNGCGMRREELKEYHNIAATSKVRGRGIGFAGIGAKLSLLVADRVITETKGRRGTRAATEWRMTNPTRAPWKFITFGGSIVSPQGTSVTIYPALSFGKGGVYLNEKAARLLDPEFIAQTIRKYYFAIIHPALAEKLQRFIYRKGIEFYINNKKLEPAPASGSESGQAFEVSFGEKNRRPVGFGYLARFPSAEERSIPFPGLNVSTYGKMIKSGWEWLGILPRSFEKVAGMVEIPGLAEILTTNKADFLNDATSLKKYYRYRKAVQEAVRPILQEWGEERIQPELFPEKRPRALERKIEEVLGAILGEFPELSPLVSMRYRQGEGKIGKDKKMKRAEYLTGVAEGKEPLSAEKEPASSVEKEKSPAVAGEGTQRGRRKEHGLRITFEEGASEEILARLVEDTVFVNTEHPAWKKARRDGAEDYHIILATAWALSLFLEESHPAHAFVSRFLACWGKEAPRLF